MIIFFGELSFFGHRRSSHKSKGILEIGSGSLTPILESEEDTDSDRESSELDVQGEWYHPCYVQDA